MLSPKVRNFGAALGIAGPVGFISAWVGAGAATPGYSPVSEHISRLAASGTSTHAAMTAGLVAYGVTAPIFARVVGDELSKPAAFALDISDVIDKLHAASAFGTYVSLTLVPILASRALKKRGYIKTSRASIAIGAIAGVSFAASLLGPAHGLFQRVGITTVDVWLVGAAVVILAKPNVFKLNLEP